MLIDWFTVSAQIVNFLILVWLLQRFLYRPILDAIDAREQRVAAALTKAEANKEEARAGARRLPPAQRGIHPPAGRPAPGGDRGGRNREGQSLCGGAPGG